MDPSSSPAPGITQSASGTHSPHGSARRVKCANDGAAYWPPRPASPRRTFPASLPRCRSDSFLRVSYTSGIPPPDRAAGSPNGPLVSRRKGPPDRRDPYLRRSKSRHQRYSRQKLSLQFKSRLIGLAAVLLLPSLTDGRRSTTAWLSIVSAPKSSPPQPLVTNETDSTIA